MVVGWSGFVLGLCSVPKTRHVMFESGLPSYSSGGKYEIVTMPDKGGFGILAACDLVPGELLLREAPLLRLTPGDGGIDAAHGLGGDRERCRALLATLSQRVGGNQGSAASDVHTANFDAVIRTNGFVIDDSGETVVFLTISRINHDCSPNAMLRWDEETAEASIVIEQPVSAGREVTIDYGAMGDVGARRRHLKDRFGFDCACALCTAELSRVS